MLFFHGDFRLLDDVEEGGLAYLCYSIPVVTGVINASGECICFCFPVDGLCFAVVFLLLASLVVEENVVGITVALAGNDVKIVWYLIFNSALAYLVNLQTFWSRNTPAPSLCSLDSGKPGLQYRMPSSAALFEGLTGQLLLLIEIRCKETDPNAYINDLYESDDYSERSVQNFKSMHTPPFREVSNSFRSVKHNVEGKP
ncbi:hypothetical protein V6N13_038440 [Hibiscus sabdariffa]|uniref:Uncharacterized protein n=1 Tax=Hibiscus sabdariffa TaxID=183260 RepID=A0ABR2S2X4_9ROSI